MRIALVHAFGGASGSGGADDAVLDQAAALGRAGHEVRLVGRAATPHGRGPLPELRVFAPDVVHVHRLSAALGRSWAAEWTRPLVATLHDQRPPGGDGGDRWAGVRGAWRRGARLAALPLARASRGGLREDPLLRRADRVIVLSELSRETYERAGLPPERLAVVPHYVPLTDRATVAADVGRADTWVCVARLTPEEHVLDLLRRWPAGRRLDIVGTGPLAHACRAAAPASVRFLGALGPAALRRALPGHRGLVLPGRWVAGALPPVYPEALAAGLPVLAFEGSAAPRTVRADGTGTIAAWDAPLAAALDAAERIFPTLRAHCRGVHAKRYGEAAWVERAEEVYAAVVRSAHDRAGDRPA
ncbi:glycosyltransferase [Streptomyces sp. NPDC102406]|uniref:glycosyltransferase n=1 Tax=Streptomyces sp. NPDC102406 TaxID=3366171 RepID=UPI003809B27A